MQCVLNRLRSQQLFPGQSAQLSRSFRAWHSQSIATAQNITHNQRSSLSHIKNNTSLRSEYSTIFLHNHGLLRRNDCPGSLGSCSTALFHSDEERTYATILNKEEGAPLMLDSYSERGFRLNNGVAVVGSIAVFPKSVLSWNITSADQITEESLSLFHMLAPKINLLVLGIGDAGSKFNLRLLTFMRDKGVSLEILPTDKAVATFNFLNSEGRSIAGAFIPPRTLNYRADDYADSLKRKRELYIDKLPNEFL